MQDQSKGRTTATKGTQFLIQKELTTTTAITTIAPTTATITTASAVSGVTAGDMILISGASNGFNGYYPVKSVSNTNIVLIDEVKEGWKDKTAPTVKGNVQLVKFHDNFCSIKSISKDSDTLTTEDVTTLCSESSEFEPGEIEVGSLKLTFFYAPDELIQADLRKKFRNKETFAYKMIFSNNRGTSYGSGFIENSMNVEGQVKGKFESGISIKQSKLDYYQAV